MGNSLSIWTEKWSSQNWDSQQQHVFYLITILMQADARCIHVLHEVGGTWRELRLIAAYILWYTYVIVVSPGEQCSPMHTRNQFVLFSALSPIKLLLCNCYYGMPKECTLNSISLYFMIQFHFWFGWLRTRSILANVGTLYASQHGLGHNAICCGRWKCDGKIIMRTVRLREGRQ